MNKNVCRAITFINYHIPIVMAEGAERPQYSTIGFFDGMFTERLNLNYESDDLKELWRYSLKKTEENKGSYSFQNIFGFSKDEWNNWTDEKFWLKETDKEYPLTFIVFLQLEDYVTAIGHQCKAFNEEAGKVLEGQGISYTYGTIDKNDFIVCIKCRRYERAVRAIKKLHNTSTKVIYSYSIFSVNSMVLDEIKDDQNNFLFQEQIASICLKGIVNSCDSAPIMLDKKYRVFCMKLARQLYDDLDFENVLKDSEGPRLYDILGDNDFRFIARQVNLGKLLSQYASGGVLCYTEKLFPYYLFSSDLALNTLNDLTDESSGQLGLQYAEQEFDKMKKKWVSPYCDELIKKLPKIQEALKNKSNSVDEKIITFCNALFQLLQSLKVLESAPTKKYDFLSLYPPFQFLAEILEEKLKNEDESDIGQKETIYEFIHTISMTLHGTLRTDIQFFQIRDFNVIVHYAPAKLRAYYAIWALKLKEFYKEFGETSHEYSFIFAPGMYKETSVEQLFRDYKEKKRLMLITVPERHLYAPRWLMVIMAHEVSHFVGGGIREREKRHILLLKMSARILELELHSYMYHGFSKYYAGAIKSVINENRGLLSEIETLLLEEEKEIENEIDSEEESQYKFHSLNSEQIIREAYSRMLYEYFRQISYDYSAEIKESLMKQIRISNLEEIKKIMKSSNNISEEILNLWKTFIDPFLSDVLDKLSFIMSEAFADIIAILTLELFPKDYIFSFSKTELVSYEAEDIEEDTPYFLEIRIALVMESINSIVKKNHSDSFTENFSQQWNFKEPTQMPDYNKLSKKEKKIINNVEKYKESILDWQGEIDNYERKYQPNVDNSEISDDFLRDKKVWDYLCEYLSGCGTQYINTIKENMELREQRNSLLQSYKQVSEKTEIELMEEIEDFLKKWEQKNKK